MFSDGAAPVVQRGTNSEPIPTEFPLNWVRRSHKFHNGAYAINVSVCFSPKADIRPMANTRAPSALVRSMFKTLHMQCRGGATAGVELCYSRLAKESCIKSSSIR